MPNEKVTYFTYNEGLEAKHLHLGNLVHDYRKPNSLDPYVETAYTEWVQLQRAVGSGGIPMTDAHPSIEEPAPAWALSTPLENYALTLGESSTEDLDAEDQTIDSADKSGAAKRYRVAAAAKTTKIEIKE
jgi:hypothetical protein